MSFKTQQKGFSLFIVLMVMLIIALLVIVTNQSSLTELRLSSNEADRKIALSRAEYGLREAEEKIQQYASEGSTITFTDACTNGLCQPVKDSFTRSTTSGHFTYGNTNTTQIVAWLRCANDPTKECTLDSGETVLDSKKHSIETQDKKGRYIIEYLGAENTSTVSSNFFRITTKTQGNNDDTQVTLQSYVELFKDIK